MKNLCTEEMCLVDQSPATLEVDGGYVQRAILLELPMSIQMVNTWSRTEQNCKLAACVTREQPKQLQNQATTFRHPAPRREVDLR
ncbi:unnamed protein product [Angiostrongylus costaricensis]|uniref:Phlebovirus glycoprotein G2 fusion domain-containing protein n=1 Tax=Angiostrongylus costaricensis TaxID=334426 RepID=A0A0R3PRF0_ANGCS|nr:unnamed protein product [Angiostrongylus costaricensis]